jgi:amino acid transporter
MSALVLITLLNILGIKKVKAFQTPILGLTTILILVICIIQLFDASFSFSRPMDGAIDLTKNDPVKVAEAAALVFVAYAGIYKAGALGGEIKQPERNLPNGMLISLLAITSLYVFVTFIMMGAVDGEWWVDSNGNPREDPIFAFVDLVASTEIGIIMALLAFLTMISGALSGLLAASRFLFALAKDCLLPNSLSETNERFGTPQWSIIITGLAMGICILTLPVKDVAKLASGFQIMVIIALNACVIVLRKSSAKNDWYQPTFKSPLYPFVQIFGIISGILLVYLMGSKALIGAVAALILGFATYKIYGEKNYQKQIIETLESE